AYTKIRSGRTRRECEVGGGLGGGPRVQASGSSRSAPAGAFSGERRPGAAAGAGRLPAAARRARLVRCRPTLPELSKALASYIPALVTRRLSADPRPLHRPQAEIITAAVLCADVSGYTALTEALARQGPAGVEKVAAGLNAYFDRLIEITASHGGDVVK